MEISDKSESQNNKDQKIIIKEESILKQAGDNNNFGLINNEVKPSDYNIDETLPDENKIGKKCKLYKPVGNTLFLFLDKFSNPIFIIGPQWPVFICLITVISLIMLFLYLKYWSLYGFYTKLIGGMLYWTFIISYIYTSLINPGYPRNTIGRSFGIPKNDYYYCEYCKFYLKKCSYSSHCEICQICIEKHDHHCFWTGHCIGKNNKISFVIFIISVFCLIFYFSYALYEGLVKN